MRLRQLLLTLTFAISSIYLYAQTVPDIQWQKSYGGSSFDNAFSIQQTSDGGYIVAGSSASHDSDVVSNHGSWDVWILKLDPAGNIEWKKSLGGSGVDEAASVQQTADGGYIVAGSTSSYDGDVTGNHATDKYDCWIIKLSGTGDIEWQKNFGGNGDDEASDVQQTTDGGYIVAGHAYSIDGDVTGNHGESDYWVLKLSSNGNIEWQKTLGGSGYDWGYSIRQTVDGGYIVAGGSASSDGDLTGIHGNFDYWLVKLGSAGDIEWQKSFGGNGADIANCIRQTADLGYIVAGKSYSTNGDVTGNHGDWDYWIVKLTVNGDIEWQKSLGGSVDDESFSIEQTNDNGYIVAGYASSVNGDIIDNSGGDDYWIAKLAVNGDIEWQKNLGGPYQDRAFAIRQTTDGGYITAGFTNFLSTGLSNFLYLQSDFLIVKLGFGTLAARLSNFSAQKQGKDILVKWQAAEDLNTKNFEIQRSKNGVDFNTVGVVNQIAGNITNLKQYSFRDSAPLDNISYYRLKQNDKDAHFEYSTVAKVFFTDKTASLLYPNPASSIIHIISSGKIKAVSILDISGKTIRNFRPTINNAYSINNLSNGNYWVKLIYENSFEMIRLSKQ
ncbi:MAG TPA: T9SS type A sorting domain-containing protein [Panacibacter sp.]|nr:T9SS type A sorting domain-containing protein [Panacibacter sp.]